MVSVTYLRSLSY